MTSIKKIRQSLITSTKTTNKQAAHLIKSLKTNYPDSLLSISNSMKKSSSLIGTQLFDTGPYKPLNALKPIPSINTTSSTVHDEHNLFNNSETESTFLNRSDESNSDFTTDAKKIKRVELRNLTKPLLTPNSLTLDKQIQLKVEQKLFEKSIGHKY